MLGFSRLGVAEKGRQWDKYIERIGRSLTLRDVAHVTYDTNTGRRYPEYTESTITGVLVERGGSTPSAFTGVYVLRDAVLVTLYGVKERDELQDPVSSKYYIVRSPINNHYAEDGTFIYRDAQLALKRFL
jgi:hypothetical protein